MNAKIVLAAIAAVCCVQGIAAASVVRPLPFFEVEEKQNAPEVEIDLGQIDLGMIDFENMDVDAILDDLVKSLEKARTEALSNNKLGAPRNIFTCITSLVGVAKEAKEVKELVDEFSKIKKDLKEAENKCKTPAADDTTENCNKKAKETYETAEAAAKAKIIPTVFKVFTTLFSLKACLSIF